jgi:hypothetical protein
MKFISFMVNGVNNKAMYTLVPSKINTRRLRVFIILLLLSILVSNTIIHNFNLARTKSGLTWFHTF